MKAFLGGKRNSMTTATRNRELRMRMSSRKSNRRHKIDSSLYSHMFLEDMCASFAISFSPSFQSDDFYIVSPESSILKQLLDTNHSRFLRYKFDQLLSWNMNELLRYGRCYVEIIPVVEEEELLSIRFESLSASRAFKLDTKTLLFSRDFMGDYHRKTVVNNLLIKLDLKDMGIQRMRFKRILKKLSKKDLPDFDFLNQNGISISDYDNKQKLSTFKLVGDTYWSLRDYSSVYITEVYLLYRKVKHDNYRLRFLEYLLAQYNQAIQVLGNQYGFSGKIEIAYEIDSHLDDLKELLSGNLSCKQMSDILYSRLR